MVSAETGDVIGPGDAAGSSYWRSGPHALAAPVDHAGVLYRLSVDAVIEIGSSPGIGESVVAGWPSSASDDPSARPPVVFASLQPRAGGAAHGSDTAAFVDAVARAYEAGFGICAAGLFAGEARRRVPLPGYPFQRIRHWVDPPQTA